MSSVSERLQRFGPVGLLVVVLGLSALAYSGITPLFGAPQVPASVSKPIDRATALLARAKRPYDQVTFCEPLKAYVPDLVELGHGGVRTPEAPFRPVILCSLGAEDLGAAISHAGRDGLNWTRRIAGTPMVAFAADEARFNAAFGTAGLTIPASDLLSFSPVLHALRSNAPGVVDDDSAWRVPAHADDGLVLFGPYLDLAGGAYRLRLHEQLQGSPAQCREAVARYHPSFGVTRDSGTGGVRPRGPATVSVDRADPCSLTVEDAFTVEPGGAKTVETPFYGATTLPMRVDAYALEPAASAQSR